VGAHSNLLRCPRLLQGTQKQNSSPPKKTVNFRSFSAQPTSNREVELMEEEDGGGWGCIYRQRLTEADALAEPSLLIDLPRYTA
jgi:hypothetical protein